MYVRKVAEGFKISFQVTRTVPEKDLHESVAKIAEEVADSLHALAEQLISPYAVKQGYTEASMDSKGVQRLKKGVVEASPDDKEE